MADGMELRGMQGFVFDSNDFSMVQGELGGVAAAPRTSSMAGEWTDENSEDESTKAAGSQQPADGEIEFEQLPDDGPDEDEFERYLRGDDEE